MLDDLIELVVDVGVELLGGIIGHRKKKNKQREEKKLDATQKEPWEKKEDKPPWED